MLKIKWINFKSGDMCLRLYIPPSFELGLGFHIAILRYEVWIGLLFFSISFNWIKGIKSKRRL